MPRTPLAHALRQHVGLLRRAATEGRPVDEVRDAWAEEREARRRRLLQVEPSGINRRRFLQAMAGVAAGAGVMSVGRWAWATEPRIAIVGGGLSGLTAALHLADAGYQSTVYEASPVNVGGRCQTDWGSAQAYSLDPPYYDSGLPCAVCHDSRSRGDDGAWEDGHVTDMFGELIDTNHTTMIGLCDRFGIPLVDLLAAQPPGAEETYHFFGHYYPKWQADADWSVLYPILHRDLNSAGYPTSWERARPGGIELDNLSIHDWIADRVARAFGLPAETGHSHPLGALLDVAYAIEFGADTTDQSSLNLIYLLGYGNHQVLNVFGQSDERFRVVGGVGRIPMSIARHLGWDETVRIGYWLESIRQAADGSYILDFEVDGGSHHEVRADIVLLTLPFAVLQNLDYGGAGFDALKQDAIQELGRGKNGKLQLQFTERYWNRTDGSWVPEAGISSGTLYSDTGFQAAWEASRGLPDETAVLLKYTGGSPVDLLRQKHPYGNATNSRVVDDAEGFLAELEPLFPGIGAPGIWNGKVAGSMPHFSQYFNCSYSYWRVGQYQWFAGYEGVRQGNVFFAGEHCSLDYQGWMEGAVRSAVTAAGEIVASLRGPNR